MLLLLITAALTSAVFADGETVTLGTGTIAVGSRVYFGNILWRVLSDGTVPENSPAVVQSGKALLISNDILERIQFNPDYTAANANQWQGSNAQTWCNNYYTNWTNDTNKTSAEKDAILATTVEETNDQNAGFDYYYQGGHYNDYYGAAPLSDAFFFFLSAKEADELFTDDNDRKASGAGTSYWWLRSSDADSSDGVGDVDNDGWVDIQQCR